MKRGIHVGYLLAALCASAEIGSAAELPPAAAASAPAKPAQASDNLPMVPPAKPGVFTALKKGADRFDLVVAGHKLTTRDDIEKYLAYRAADLTMEHEATWFTFVESRSTGDTAPEPKRDPAGLRYSFRMEYFRPVWRYKTSGSPAWKTWSPFTGAPFTTDDPKTITDFEVSADIVLHRGQMDDANPLAFEAGAVSDLLINQVSPPE
ncbi:CC0125/CC1285 family lipoprotein [Bradyrhizobium genosp. P]|uniref:CC0125/CC1285 family lipoprotein n=1 Tax=Bradyrhizobium genosp. P TaxID=83641 RepID=UPI003CF0B1D0